MTEDTVAEAKDKPESPERLTPGAIAHYLHWAHVFMQRYYKERFNMDMEEAPSIARQQYSYLREFTGKMVNIQNIDDKQMCQFELGKLVYNTETRLIETLTNAYGFARAGGLLETGRSPASSQEPDTLDPEKTALTGENFEKLARGLKASLGSLGHALGSLSTNPHAGAYGKAVSKKNLKTASRHKLHNRYINSHLKSLINNYLKVSDSGSRPTEWFDRKDNTPFECRAAREATSCFFTAFYETTGRKANSSEEGKQL
jgi:hypothetical protein